MARLLMLFLLCAGVGCAPSDTAVTAVHRTAPLDLSALHTTGLAAMSTGLTEPQRIDVARACTDIGADVSIHLQHYFARSWWFTILAAPLIALLFGGAAAYSYWKILAPRRKVGWLPFLGCVGSAWVLGALAAIAVHWILVVPALTHAVAAHRSLFTLAQEGWIPASADSQQRDFTANCSDRIADIVQGGQSGHDGLKRYQSLFGETEVLPAEEADDTLYGTVIQNRARDLLDLYRVDTGLGKSKVRALTWSDVIVQNSRFKAAMENQGGWWIHSSFHPVALLLIAVGIPLVTWFFLLMPSKRITAAVARRIKKYVHHEST